jgi:quinoprotein glucose dehydrogenase
MRNSASKTTLIVTASLLIILGLGLAAGGAWLIQLGGSWYYLLGGLALVATGVLLALRKALALWIYAGLVLCTLVWSVWEAGLDWWPLAARGDVVFCWGCGC